MRIAVLGASTLAGRELVERLRAAGLDSGGLALAEPGADSAALTKIGDEIVVWTPRTADVLEGARVAFTCTRLAPDDEALVRAQAAQAIVIDLTGTLGAPAFDARQGAPLSKGLHASASASSLLVASLVRAARACSGAAAPPGGGAGSASAVVLEPASELGREAIDELFGQAVAALNFGDMPRAFFGRQVVHDVHSPGFGGGEREAVLRREVAELLGGPALPLLVLRPGTFHGVAAAVHARVDPSAWRAALSKEPRLIVVAEDEVASPVGAVQSERALVGRVVDDGCGGAWAWAAADSLVQGAVGNAVEALAMLVAGEARAH